MKIGLIEDNEDFRAEIKFHLIRSGYEVALESDGRDIDAQLSKTICDLLLVDIGLPGEDGFSIAKRVRKLHPKLGIIMLTARTSIDDRLNSLLGAADAYLTKPLDMREMIATIQSVTRRLPLVEDTVKASWSIDQKCYTLFSPQGDPVLLTASEMSILKCLAVSSPLPATREMLAQAIGHFEQGFDDRRLEVTISRLRRKLPKGSDGTTVLRSARTKGYLFAAPLQLSN